MVKFVKLESGKYLNIDKIIFITPNGDDGTATFSDDRFLIVTDKDVENVLKASEEQ